MARSRFFALIEATLAAAGSSLALVFDFFVSGTSFLVFVLGVDSVFLLGIAIAGIF